MSTAELHSFEREHKRRQERTPVAVAAQEMLWDALNETVDEQKRRDIENLIFAVSGRIHDGVDLHAAQVTMLQLELLKITGPRTTSIEPKGLRQS